MTGGAGGAAGAPRRAPGPPAGGRAGTTRALWPAPLGPRAGRNVAGAPGPPRCPPRPGPRAGGRPWAGGQCPHGKGVHGAGGTNPRDLQKRTVALARRHCRRVEPRQALAAPPGRGGHWCNTLYDRRGGGHPAGPTGARSPPADRILHRPPGRAGAPCNRLRGHGGGRTKQGSIPARSRGTAQSSYIVIHAGRRGPPAPPGRTGGNPGPYGPPFLQ